MKNNLPFGGIPFIGIGDFRQVAPVVKGSGSTPSQLASVKSSSVWPSFRINALKIAIRSARDPEYTRAVDEIGEDYKNKRIGISFLARLDDIEDSIRFLFPMNILENPLASLKRAFLSPKNCQVDEFNDNILRRLAGHERQFILPCFAFWHIICLRNAKELYYSADVVKENEYCDEEDLTADYLALLTQNGVPPHILRLKKGCVCSLMRNLSVRQGLVKNARVVVRELHRRFIEVQVVDNRLNTMGGCHCIPRIRFEFSPPHTSWTIQRLQFPLRVAYACTFNGCVGLTLDKTVIDLRNPVFAHGQLYTALSRVRCREDSRVLMEPGEKDETENVVYKELLL
jgi:hypothetical protein